MKKGSKHTEESKRKMSQSLKGKRRSPATEFKKGEPSPRKGKKATKPSWNKGLKVPSISGKNNPAYGKVYFEGEEHHNWKGDKVGYWALHHWIERKLGKPTKCEHCEKDGLTNNKIHWANKDHTYKRNTTDWIRLCASCHKNYDIKNRLCKN